LYYRLLRSGADPKTVIAPVVQTNTNIPNVFTEDDHAILRAELMDEFNTLATVYGKASVNFIRPEFQVLYKKQPPEHPLEANMGIIDTPDGGHHVPLAPQGMPTTTSQDPTAETTTTAAAAPAPAPAAADAMVADLLGFDGPVAAAPAPVAAVAAPARGASVFLAPAVTMTGETYQSSWGGIPDAEAIVSTVSLGGIPTSTNVVEAALAAVHVFTMASGELPNEFKFFLYAQDATSQSLLLVQSNISKGDTADPLMILTVKVHGGDKASVADQSKVDHLTKIIQSVLG
jgi:hypothetical protein